MKLGFWGAVRTVTGSMHCLEANGLNLLLDCGLFQGRRQESYERNSHFPFVPQDIEAMVLSHAHMDHSGNIPNLVRAGFAGNIFATAATRDLASAMLLDSGHIQEQDAAYLNKKLAERGGQPVKPLYTVADATACMSNFVGLGYARPFPALAGMRLTLLDAGHILGSALVILDVEEGGRKLRVCYTGDLGTGQAPILRPPAIPRDVDVLIIESTYGNRRHEAPEAAAEKLKDIVIKTWERGGKVVVPAFAVGRTQALVYTLHRLMLSESIPDLPIFVDSPLAVNVTEVFRLHPECYDKETMEFLTEKGDPFGFDRLTYVRSVEASKQLNFVREPSIIISASGMAENGRILHHLKNTIADPRNTVLLVGYMAENTLGRKIQDRQAQVPILGEMVPLRARVEEIGGFSAHADSVGLLGWVKAMRGERLKRVFVVHGEEEEGQALATALRGLGGLEVTVPEPGQVVDLG